MLTLHCPPAQVYALASFLREHGADTVSVASLDYVFDRDNPLYAKLEAFSAAIRLPFRSSLRQLRVQIAYTGSDELSGT